MKKTISVLLIMSLLVTSVSCHSLMSYAVEMDFESAEPIKCGETYEVTVEDNGDYLIKCGETYKVTVKGNGGYLIVSFTAPEDGYYLFEALGKKNIEPFPSYEPVITLYDSDKNELQYAEFDFYKPEFPKNEPYAKTVQKLKKGEVCYFKTNFLNPDIIKTNHSNSNKKPMYSIKAMTAPDFVFTYMPSDEESGWYELYQYCGRTKELTINNSFTVGWESSLFESPFENIPLEVIGLNSFENNEYLESLTIPDKIYYIASNAFLNCKNLKEVTIGKSTMTVGYRAFAGCESLKTVKINSYDVNLEHQCLGYDAEGQKYDDFTIVCHKGSTAETYAKENNFNTTIIRKNTVSADKTSKTNSNNNSAPASANKKTTSSTNKKQTINKPKVKRAVIKKISKTSKKKHLKIKWKKLKNVTGYQIKCGLNKKTTKGKKVYLTKTNCKSKTIKGLKSKRKYYVKIRAYKTYKSPSGKILKAYGKWSKIKKAITR